MKLLIEGKSYTQDSIAEQIEEFKQQLTNNTYVNLLSTEWDVHFAAYAAWREVGGVLLINNPRDPKKFHKRTQAAIESRTFSEPSICFLTSGTTGNSKIVVHNRETLEHVGEMARQAPGWEPTDRPVTMQPAFTVGFWFFHLVPGIDRDFTLTCTTPNHNPKGLGNVLLTTPGQVDNARINVKDISYEGYRYVLCGASQVLPKHINFLFENGAQNIGKTYGSTETGAPTLIGHGTPDDPFNDCYRLEPLGNLYELKIIDRELWVRAPSFAVNINEFDALDSNGWYNTHDVFDTVDEEHYRFAGRRSDTVKMNGFNTNLLHAENTIEELFDCGVVSVIKRNRLGSDYLDMLYTNKDWNPTQEELHAVLDDQLPKCCIPKKCTWVEDVPRTPLGKKLRIT